MKKVKQEIKIDVTNIDIVKKLRNSKAILLGSKQETTIRYDTEDKKYEKSGKYIRVMEGFKNCITLKEKVNENDKLFERDEFEIEIDDVENTKIILEKIGLKPILKMQKYRLKWNINGIRINIDELPFGLYMEIYGNEDEIQNVLKKLEIQDEPKIIGTYWDIYELYKDKNNFNENIIFSKGYDYKLM